VIDVAGQSQDGRAKEECDAGGCEGASTGREVVRREGGGEERKVTGCGTVAKKMGRPSALARAAKSEGLRDVRSLWQGSEGGLGEGRRAKGEERKELHQGGTGESTQPERGQERCSGHNASGRVERTHERVKAGLVLTRSCGGRLQWWDAAGFAAGLRRAFGGSRGRGKGGERGRGDERARDESMRGEVAGEVEVQGSKAQGREKDKGDGSGRSRSGEEGVCEGMGAPLARKDGAGVGGEGGKIGGCVGVRGQQEEARELVSEIRRVTGMCEEEVSGLRREGGVGGDEPRARQELKKVGKGRAKKLQAHERGTEAMRWSSEVDITEEESPKGAGSLQRWDGQGRVAEEGGGAKRREECSGLRDEGHGVEGATDGHNGGAWRHDVREVDVDFAHQLNAWFGREAGEEDTCAQQEEAARTRKRKLATQATKWSETQRDDKKRSGIQGRRLKESERQCPQQQKRRARVATEDMLEQFGERKDP